MSDDALLALGSAAGLMVEWRHANGELRHVPVDTIRAVLQALGYAVSNPSDIAASLQRAQNASPPRLRIVHDGREPGYYEDEHGLAAVPPQRCFSVRDIAPRRFAGVAVQLYSLRGGHTAEFGDLAALGELARHIPVDAITVSPLHAPFSAACDRNSPYSPSSRFFLNPIYADIALAGAAPSADDGNTADIDWSQAGPKKIAALREAYARFDIAAPDFYAFCSEGGEHLARHAIFEALDAHFRAMNVHGWRNWPEEYRNPKSAAVDHFAREHVKDVKFHFFLQWLTAKSLQAAQKTARENGMKIGIITDLAIGTDPNGSQAWSAPDEMLAGLSVGAPPDVFNPAGQDWGLTALSPTGLRESGYAAFIDTLRAAMRYAGGVRIDHVIGFERLWLVPHGAKPDEGVYLRYPMRELFDLVALESQRCRAIVVGEDLGTVSERFREELARRGVLGMEVMWFQREGERFIPPGRWSQNALATTTTHDLPTVAGWWGGRDIDWMEKLHRRSSHGDVAAERRAREHDQQILWSAFSETGVVQADARPLADDPAPAVCAAIKFVSQSPADLAIIPIEDVLALREQPNIPGTIDEHPNWRRRLPPSDVLNSQIAKDNLDALTRDRR